jgi:phosphopantetheinyl transferase (holo-ACP synthase)
LLVGNDVIDLGDPESRLEELHPRFDERVYTDEERATLRASASPHALRWTLWAAKESAYKVAKKLDPTVRFLWRDFVVRQIGAGRAVVTHETGAIDVLFDRADQWVHVVATLSTDSALSPARPAVWGIRRLNAPDADPSSTVRKWACRALATQAGLSLGDLRIGSDRGIPVALCRDRRLPFDLSLSHHGRFVAWVWGDCRIPNDQRGFVAA